MPSPEDALIVPSLVTVCPLVLGKIKEGCSLCLNKCKMPSPEDALIVPSLVKIGPAVLEKRKI